MSPPRLLVVTPTLGHSPWLDETVASVAAQSMDTTHVLCAPASELTALAQRYPHALVVRDAGKSGGIYGALNAALAQSPPGWDWFTYINDDDALLPALGEVFQSHVAGPNPAPVLYGDVALVEPGGQILSRITTEKNPRWIPALLQQEISPLMQQGMLFHRDAVTRLRGFDQRYRLCADLDFWLRAYAAGFRFHYCGRTVALFRLRPGQLSQDTSLTEKEQSEIVHRHLPSPVSRSQRLWARVRYRLYNLPRYLARFRRRGFVTSYHLLAQGGAR